MISLLRDIFEAVGINLYLFPYGVLPTGPERGIIEVRISLNSLSDCACVLPLLLCYFAGSYANLLFIGIHKPVHFRILEFKRSSKYRTWDLGNLEAMFDFF